MKKYIWIWLFLTSLIFVSPAAVSATAIVGIAENGTVYLGGDSAITSGDKVYTLPEIAADENLQKIITPLRGKRKVLVLDNFMIGFCGKFNILVLLESKLPSLDLKPKDTETAHDFVARSFVPALRKLLAIYGYTWIESGRLFFSGEILITCRGHLFHINSDFKVTEHKEHAIGSGGEDALRSLKKTKGQEAVIRILDALREAAKNDPGVKPPFYVLHFKP